MKKSSNEQFFSNYIKKVAFRAPMIAVIGSGSCQDDIYKLSEEVGKEIAVRGGIVVCGGLFGVMEGCCKGAKSAGGFTIGILPGISIDDANDYVDIPIATGMNIARNAVIAQTARVAIAISGEYGTLSEISMFFKLGKPVIGLKTWDFVKDIIPAETPIAAVDEAFKQIL